MKHLILITVAFLVSIQAVAETRYVSDVLQIQLRSGPGTQYRILKTLQTGTALQVEDTVGENGYVQVTFDGKTGWVAKQYLMGQPSARIQLSKLQKELETFKANASPTENKLMALEEENQQLKLELTDSQASLTSVRQELDRITEVSGKAIELDASNQKLRLENSNLINEMDILRIENTRLAEQNNRDFILYGAFAVFLGVIIALIVPHLTVKKKHSEWF
jgi:SH3 domain protein